MWNRYQSKFRSTVKEEKTTNKSPNKTMGPAKVDLKAPKDYLSKHSKEPVLPEKTTFKYPDEDKRKPMVPKKEDRPLMGLKSGKNFITTNAVENIMSVPKKPASNFVDTVKGSTHPLEPSGLVPKFRNKKVGLVFCFSCFKCMSDDFWCTHVLRKKGKVLIKHTSRVLSCAV